MTEDITEWTDREDDIVREVLSDTKPPSVDNDGDWCWTPEEVRNMLLRAIRAGAQSADKPRPCVISYVSFDFAECDTHDTQFPVDGKCKWDGVESITQFLNDEVDAQRSRAAIAEGRLQQVRDKINDYDDGGPKPTLRDLYLIVDGRA